MRRRRSVWTGSRGLGNAVVAALALCGGVRVHVSASETVRRPATRHVDDTEEDPVRDSASPPPRTDPTDTGPDLELASDTVAIDPDDTEVVPAALMGLVAAARTTYRAMQANGCYPAIMAVGAVEDTVATLARI